MSHRSCALQLLSCSLRLLDRSQRLLQVRIQFLSVRAQVHLELPPGLLRHANEFGFHAGNVVFVSVSVSIPYLLICEVLACLRQGEAGEQEGVNRLIEERLLGCLAVLVHGVSDQVKALYSVTQVRIVLVVPVGKQEQLEIFQEKSLVFIHCQIVRE
jgi:hypothetical protein